MIVTSYLDYKLSYDDRKKTLSSWNFSGFTCDCIRCLPIESIGETKELRKIRANEESKLINDYEQIGKIMLSAKTKKEAINIAIGLENLNQLIDKQNKLPIEHQNILLFDLDLGHKLDKAIQTKSRNDYKNALLVVNKCSKIISAISSSD